MRFSIPFLLSYFPSFLSFNHKNRLKYKVEIKKKGYRKPKMTRHAKNTSCLDIIKDILKETSQEESWKLR
jgi:hypothetical protein